MGGLTIAQDPDTADYQDMPSNAIATQDVDFIVPPEQMGELILKYIHHQPTDEYRPGRAAIFKWVLHPYSSCLACYGQNRA
jgi:hypothetical protein